MTTMAGNNRYSDVPFATSLGPLRVDSTRPPIQALILRYSPARAQAHSTVDRQAVAQATFQAAWPYPLLPRAARRAPSF